MVVVGYGWHLRVGFFFFSSRRRHTICSRDWSSACALPISLLGASTDWFGLIDRTAYGQQHDLAFSSAGTDMSYRLSLGYMNQDGVIRASSTERLSLGLNYQQRLFSDRLNVRANVRGSRALDRFTPGDVLGNAAGMAPTQPVMDPASATGYWDWNTTNASA